MAHITGGTILLIPVYGKMEKLSSTKSVTGAKKFGDHYKGYCSIHQITDTMLLSGPKKKKTSKISLALLAQQGLGGSSSKFHSVRQKDMCFCNCACVNVFKISTVKLFPKKDTIVRDTFIITLYTLFY